MENEISTNVFGYQDATMGTSSHISGHENDTHGQEMKEAEVESFSSTPMYTKYKTKPNVPIEDETICPICTETGVCKRKHIYMYL